MGQIEIGWLPLGSVVMVRGQELPVMVYGRFQRNVDTGEVYEYVGCRYPIGHVGPEANVFFNGDSVEQLIFLGYRDKAELEFVKFLEEQAGSPEGGGEE